MNYSIVGHCGTQLERIFDYGMALMTTTDTIIYKTSTDNKYNRITIELTRTIEGEIHEGGQDYNAPICHLYWAKSLSLCRNEKIYVENNQDTALNN